MSPYKMEKEYYLSKDCLDAWRMLPFMIEQVFLPEERFGLCIMQIHSAQ